jgi:O-antigen ligase
LLAAVAAVTVQGILVARARGRWWVAPLGALAALAGLVLVAAVGLQEGLGRLLGTSGSDVSWGARLREYRSILELWGRFPALGSGLGTFRDAFPLVQPAELQGTWWHPHSDLLEVLATAGLLGIAILAVGLAVLLRQLEQVLSAGARSEDRVAALAAFGILASLGLHELLDFGLTMPGSALTLAVLLGSATAAKRRVGSAQLDAAGQDATTVQALELEDVQPGLERKPRPQRRRKHRSRPHRKSAHGSAVDP